MPGRSSGEWNSNEYAPDSSGLAGREEVGGADGSRRFRFGTGVTTEARKNGTVAASWARFPLPARKSGTFGLRWRGMKRKVLSMPRGPSAGMTTIRYTEVEVPREMISVSRRAESVRVEAESK
jgi:hypothetical protein